ncbi:MAG: dTDP-glucose 4,6-dehydratase [Actinomycetota bacterium]
MNDRRILVTGGAGFLGSHFVRHALRSGAAFVANLDLLTYAGDLRRLDDIAGDLRYVFVRGDVAEGRAIREVFAAYRPDVVVHYAAESHVTRSELASDAFFRTNVEGTRVVLESALEAGVERVVHVSTDEVYGPILSGAFGEDDKLPGEGAATSAYARSKALADDLARSLAAGSTRSAVIVARPTNAFGPHQFPEKAFPRWATRALRGEPLLVWGDGLYVRQWLYAEDFARAIALLVERGDPGGVYNVGPRHDPEITNLALAQWLRDRLELTQERLQMTAYDRPDHDRRYAVDPSRIEALGWAPGEVWEQFGRTLDWYRDHAAWWEPHIAEAESIYADAVEAGRGAPAAARGARP